ncbi:MAG TPA: hypothetical protein VGQ69_04790 [Gemmatimonadales bacterium]|jgi:hypothetical protein|nr:hypothetical protein [Gemmatimonadales bacterium]
MSNNGNLAGRGYPLLAIIPEGVLRPQFQVIAQWHTGTGILCAPQQVKTQILSDDLILMLFIELVNRGKIVQAVEDAANPGELTLAPLPALKLVLHAPPPAPEPPQPSRIVTP